LRDESNTLDIEKIVPIAKRRGFVFPSSEIYGGLSGFYDYGPIGKLLKLKIEESWRHFFLKGRANVFEIESSIVMHEKVWEASGHLKDFIDPLTQCTNCKTFYRSDELILEQTGRFVEGIDAEGLTAIIRDSGLKCPRCKGQLTETRIFNLMLNTNVGPATGSVAYLRPETAQGIFVNFKNIVAATRAKLPFGVAQIGRSYRNEISARHWITRLREFNQMEIEVFFNPEKANEVPGFDEIENVRIRIFTRERQKSGLEPLETTARDAAEKQIVPNRFMAYILAMELLWYTELGIPEPAIRFRHMLPQETPHYSKGNFDMEIKFDYGWKEVVGNAYRTDYDLSTHTKHSGDDLSMMDGDQKVVPHVVEPSFGIDRTVYAVLLYSYKSADERDWEWFALPPKISPYVAGIFPLMGKDNLARRAGEIYNSLKKEFDVFYDETGSIGKRYARSDEIGTPWAITVDYQSLKDDTVTVRDRNTTKQLRVAVTKLPSVIRNLIKGQDIESTSQ